MIEKLCHLLEKHQLMPLIFSEACLFLPHGTMNMHFSNSSFSNLRALWILKKANIFFIWSCWWGFPTDWLHIFISFIYCKGILELRSYFEFMCILLEKSCIKEHDKLNKWSIHAIGILAWCYFFQDKHELEYTSCEHMTLLTEPLCDFRN